MLPLTPKRTSGENRLQGKEEEMVGKEREKKLGLRKKKIVIFIDQGKADSAG